MQPANTYVKLNHNEPVSQPTNTSTQL